MCLTCHHGRRRPVATIGSQSAGGASQDFSHVVLQLLEPDAYPIHRLAPLGTFKCLAVFRNDNEDPQAGRV
jgi:hypothetical protein